MVEDRGFPISPFHATAVYFSDEIVSPFSDEPFERRSASVRAMEMPATSCRACMCGFQRGLPRRGGGAPDSGGDDITVETIEWGTSMGFPRSLLNWVGSWNSGGPEGNITWNIFQIYLFPPFLIFR